MWVVWFRRTLLALSIFFGISLLYVLLTRPDSESPSSMNNTKALSEADGGMEGFTFFHSEEGAIKWEVKADSAQVFEKKHEANLKKVTINLFGRNGKAMKLQGEDGHINTATRNFTISNPASDLSIELEGGYVVYTNHLSWTDESRLLSTKDPVRIVGKGMIVTGVGLLGKLDVEEFLVQSQVEVDLVQ